MRYFVRDTTKGVEVTVTKTPTAIIDGNKEDVTIFKHEVENNEEASKLIKSLKEEYQTGQYE